jgi:putative ABC transport system permease protein
MMSASRNNNRAMFWRIVRRLIGANPGRLFVILLALGAGAAVTAALLNLQVDAKKRLTTEFRAFGPNVIIAPGENANGNARGTTFPEEYFDRVAAASPDLVWEAAELFVVANAGIQSSEKTTPAVIRGARYKGDVATVTGFDPKIVEKTSNMEVNCRIGLNVARALKAGIGDSLEIKIAEKRETCSVSGVVATGGAEDNQIQLNLKTVQRLTALPGQISFIELRVAGNPKQIEEHLATLRRSLPDVDVRPVLQFTEGEAKIYGRISGLLTTTVAIVLLLTGLCVMAAMTNVAMERRNDVGLMKAIGGSVRRVLRLFLVEAALLGLVGGAIGAAAGIFVSIGLGKAVFGLAAQPRLIVYPVSVALTVIVAILSAYPLRRLASIRPASVFRGEA